MTRNSRRLQKAVQAIFNDYREKASCPGQVYQNAACGCDNALQMWRGPKGEKGDQGPQGPKGDNAGSFLVDAEFVVDPEGQEPGAYLKLVLIDVAQQEQVVYVDLSYLTDIYTGGNGISITDMVVAARLGAGLTFDANGNIASAYQFCDGLDETSNVVKVRLDSSNHILGFASGTCGGLTATVGLAPSATGVNLVLTGAGGTVLSTIPLEGGTGITVQKNAQTGGFTWLADPAGLVSSQTGNQLSVSQTDNKLYVGGNTLEYTFGTGAFTLKDSSGATLSSVTVPSAVRMLENMELRTDDGVYLHLTYLRDNGLRAYQDVSLDGLLCHNIDTAEDTTAAYSKAVPSGNWQTATIGEIGGKTVVWNQLGRYLVSERPCFEYATGSKIDETSTSITVRNIANVYYLVGTQPGHKVYVEFDIVTTVDATKKMQINFGGNIRTPGVSLVAGSSSHIADIATQGNASYTTFYIYPNSAAPAGVTLGDITVSNFVYIDLTLLYGSGNEPATVAEFEAMFPSIDPAYNAGELMSAGVTQAVSRGRNILNPALRDGAIKGNCSMSVGTEGEIVAANVSNIFAVPCDLHSDYILSMPNNGELLYVCLGNELPAVGTTAYKVGNMTNRAFISFNTMGYKYILIGYNDNKYDAVAQCWLERGSTATEYTPYRSPVSLPIPSAVQALPGYGWGIRRVTFSQLFFSNTVFFTTKKYQKNVSKAILTASDIPAADSGYIGTTTLGTDVSTWHEYAGTTVVWIRNLKYSENPEGGTFRERRTGGFAGRTAKFEMSINNASLLSTQNRTVFFGVSSRDELLALIGDGLDLYYEMYEPLETDISSILTDSTIEVEAGGTLTFKNQHGDDWRVPVPNSETFIYEHPWVFEDCIKELVWKELEPYSSSIADVSASFECRTVAQSIAPAFSLEICDYWDDGEDSGCYSSDYLSDTLDFSMLSGTEQKLGTLSLANNTPTNPVVSFGMGDAINSQTPLTLARRELLVSGDASALYGSGATNIPVSSLAVGSSLAFTFSNISVTEYNGTYYTGRTIALDAPTQTVEISSEVLGTFTISARVVREPDVDGKFTVSFYATATLADASTSTVPTLTLTTTDVSGETHEQEIDMSCISADISLDAGCREVTVEPATAEPFDDYILRGSVDTLLLNADGTISDLKHHNAIPDSSAARGSVTMELFNPESTDGLSIELYAKQSSGSDGWNNYSNVDPEADAQKCATLADFLAAGEQGLPLTYVEENSFSGVTPFAENETLYASVVSNGNNSYTFTFTVRTPEVKETRLVLDLVSGENRTDMKPLLGYVGGKVSTVSVPAGDAVQLPFGYAGAGYIFGSRRSDFPTVGLFANSAEDVCARTNLIQPTSVGPGADTFTYYFETLPTHFAIPSISEVDATGTKVGTTSYASPMLDMETMQCTGEGTALADIPEAGLVYTEYDTSSLPFVPTGRTLRLRATVGNAGIVFTLWNQEVVEKPMLCLEPSCDPCIDLSPVMDAVDDKFGSLSPVAASGSFNDLTDTPTNHVTTDTDQNITGTKTFVGQKKIAFKQSVAGDKLGFTLFDRNDVEVGYLEYNPSNSGKVNGVPVMTLGNYTSAASGRTYVGFRRYSSISGASGAYNLLTPLIVDARTPFNLTTTYTNFYLLLGVSDGTNMYTVGSNGVLDLSAMIPTGVAHLAGAETFTGSKTFGAGVYGNAVAMSAGAIDVSAGTVFTKTIAANTTISFSNVPAAPATACVTLILTNGGAYTVTWPSSVKWSGGSAPDLTASGVDVLTFLTIDGGTTWYGTVNSIGAA